MKPIFRSFVLGALLGCGAALAASPYQPTTKNNPTTDPCVQDCAKEMAPCITGCQSAGGSQEQSTKCMQKCAEKSVPCYNKCQRPKAK